MRKFSTIFIISIFAVSQYAKQLSYLECKVTNNFKASSDQCDCEKRLEPGKSAQAELPVPRSHTHLHPDDFFFIDKESICGSYSIVLRKKAGYYSSNECEGSLSSPFHPPRG